MSGARLAVGGGERRGLRLETPPGIRPTAGRLREALFSHWAERLPGCRFLDLFAGSGAVGIEAASRGAAAVVLVEAAPRVHAVLERNLRRAGGAGVVAVRARLPQEIERALRGAAPFDLVFADPPYGFDAVTELLAAAEPWLAPGGELALEHAWRRSPQAPERLAASFSRRYGDSGLTIYRRRRVAAGEGVG